MSKAESFRARSSMEQSDDASKSELAVHKLMELGFQPETVRPILTQLLQTYERSWEFIEADEYNVLITAVLDNKPGEPVADENESSGKSQLVSSSSPSCTLPARRCVSQASPSESTSGKEDADGDPVRSTLEAPVRPNLRRLSRNAGIATESPTGSSVRKKRKSKNARTDSPRNTKQRTLNGFCSPPSSSPPNDSSPSEDTPGSSEGGGPNTERAEKHEETVPGLNWNSSKLTRPRSLNARSRRADVESLVITRGTKAAKLKEFISAELQAHKRFRVKEKHDYDDLSKGEEKVPLAVEKGRHRIPEDFCYISKPLVYQHAKVDISLANIGDDQCCTKCYGNCIKKKFPCSCTSETGGEFPFDEGGCLKPKFLDRAIQERNGAYLVKCKGSDGEDGPCRVEIGNRDILCKGHIQRLFLKECWSKCSCHRTGCGNRVVQQGVRYRLEVFWASDAKGFGVRALEDLPAGAFVCEFAGEILTNTELDRRNEDRRRKKIQHTYPVNLDADICVEKRYDDDTLLCLDATEYGNVARFINHRCSDSNLIDVPVQIETPHRHYYHVAFFTKFAIRAMEELTWDYGIDFNDESHPIKAFECACGSEYCGGN